MTGNKTDSQLESTSPCATTSGKRDFPDASFLLPGTPLYVDLRGGMNLPKFTVRIALLGLLAPAGRYTGLPRPSRPA